MRRAVWIVGLFAVWVSVHSSARAQASSPVAAAAQIDSTAATPPASPSTTPPPAAVQPATTPPPKEPAKKPLRDRLYFGGSVVLTFGDATTIGVYPMVAYKFSPKLSLGVEVGYEYVKYDAINESGNNYGGSVFANYRFVPKLYAHAEYQMISYELFGTNASDREWVPFLLVGGGFASRLRGDTWTYVEVLFDVLQDDNSPYDNGEPIINIGVSVGF